MQAESLPAAPLLLSILSVSALVLADRLQFRPGRYLCKPMAAFAFLWLAFALLRWLRWGWGVFARDGLWHKVEWRPAMRWRKPKTVTEPKTGG